jgi:hypothetical protein
MEIRFNKIQEFDEQWLKNWWPAAAVGAGFGAWCLGVVFMTFYDRKS